MRPHQQIASNLNQIVRDSITATNSRIKHLAKEEFGRDIEPSELAGLGLTLEQEDNTPQLASLMRADHSEERDLEFQIPKLYLSIREGGKLRRLGRVR